MANFIITNKAVIDLSAIWNYKYEIWSENQADVHYTELLEACELLAKNQSFGKKYIEISAEILGYKSGQHIIFYRIINEETIEIIRFLHSKMDLKNRFHEEL